MTLRSHRLMALFISALVFLLTATVSAQNRVVVIPLMEDASPLESFAPVTADNPPKSAYTDNGDGTVTDKVTGLVWQKATADTDGDYDVDEDDKVDWHAAWDYCTNNTPLLPGTGWRLPSANELMSIVYYGTYNPAIDGTTFPGTKPEGYWSAVVRSGYSGQAVTVMFLDGNTTSHLKSVTTHYVRCVRGVSNRQNLFRNNNNETVTDLATGLTWQRGDSISGLSRDNESVDDAAAYCQQLALAGGGWRLPTIKELLSISDFRVSNPAIDTNAFPNNNGPYWSATNSASDSLAAWLAGIVEGFANPNIKIDSYWVRCVR